MKRASGLFEALGPGFVLSKRVIAYMFASTCVITYTILLVIAIVQNANCIDSHAIEDRDFDDCVLFRVDSTGSATTDSSHAMYIFIIIITWLSSITSVLVVWLIDLQSQTNGFIRIIVELCKSQMVMDMGFYLIGSAFSMHKGSLERPFPSHSGSGARVYFIFAAGNILLVAGDMAVVLWMNVICFVFVRIARNGEALKVSRELPLISLAIGFFGLAMGITESVVCSEKVFLVIEGCPMVRVRASITTCSIMANIIACLYVNDCVKKLPDGGRKTAIQQLFSRMLFYPAWNVFCRIGYMVAGLGTSSLPMAFTDFGEFLGFASCMIWCLWLPGGLGVSLFYLYTHPRETRYLMNAFLCKTGYHFLPDDIRQTMAPCFEHYLRDPSCLCVNWCPGRCCVVPEDELEASTRPSAGVGGEVVNPVVGNHVEDGCIERESIGKLSSINGANGAVTRESLSVNGADTFSSGPRRPSEGVVKVTEGFFGQGTIQEEEVLCAEILPNKRGSELVDPPSHHVKGISGYENAL